MKCVAANGSYFEGRHLPVDPDQYELTLEYEDDKTSAEEQDSSDPEEES